MFDETTPLLRASDDACTTGSVADRPPTPGRRGRRWVFAAAAAAAVVLLIVGVELTQGTGDDDVRANAPAGPNPSSTIRPTTPPTAVVIPTTVPGDDSTQGRLLPEGAPSTPSTGELVASLS